MPSENSLKWQRADDPSLLVGSVIEEGEALCEGGRAERVDPLITGVVFYARNPDGSRVAIRLRAPGYHNQKDVFSVELAKINSKEEYEN